jgi:hypothetical protein
MYAHLALLFDADLSKLEGRLIALALACAGWILQFAISRLVKRMDASQKSRHDDHIRLYQHDDEIVAKLRDGTPFPNLTKDE